MKIVVIYLGMTHLGQFSVTKHCAQELICLGVFLCFLNKYLPYLLQKLRCYVILLNVNSYLSYVNRNSRSSHVLVSLVLQAKIGRVNVYLISNMLIPSSRIKLYILSRIRYGPIDKTTIAAAVYLPSMCYLLLNF